MRHERGLNSWGITFESKAKRQHSSPNFLYSIYFWGLPQFFFPLQPVNKTQSRIDHGPDVR